MEGMDYMNWTLGCLIFTAVLMIPWLVERSREQDERLRREIEDAELEIEKKREAGWNELVKRVRAGEITERGLFGGGGVLQEIEDSLGLNGELFDEVEYRLGLRDVESEAEDWKGSEDGGEKEIIDAYSNYLDRWRRKR